jgi:hypothetical protein|nr:MAG TPA: hypothetical protein [Bacteriophage sp.]DAM61770.1 MAG TPA: hypothetical protein [Caudoviricetes sp.]
MIMQLGKCFMYALIILILFILFYSLFVGGVLAMLHLLMEVFNLGF